jgi:DNA mismatch endonuclease (patch repair protein)
MADPVDPATRSLVMARVKRSDAAPELTVRRFLHSQGLRFRLHVRQLPGTPDIVLARWRTAIQVYGCFWHAHEGCRYFVVPKTRTAFWEAKLIGNRQRDRRTELALLSSGWRLAIVWECALRIEAEASLHRLAGWIQNPDSTRLELDGGCR